MTNFSHRADHRLLRRKHELKNLLRNNAIISKSHVEVSSVYDLQPGNVRTLIETFA